jgi:hypothetical protein
MTSRFLPPFSKWNEISKELLMKKRADMQGEGNYDAAVNFNDAQQKFVESGRLAEASKKTKPKSKEEANELAQAEAQGRSRAKGSAPSIHKSGKKASGFSEEEPL